MADRQDLTGKWITKREAADWVPVSLRTINAWIARNLVQWQYTAGGAVRIWEPSLWRPDQPRRAAPGRPFAAANLEVRTQN